MLFATIFLSLIFAGLTVMGCFVGALFGGPLAAVFVAVLGVLMIAEILSWHVEEVKENKSEEKEP